MAHKVVFENCLGCGAYRALCADRPPICKLCTLMGMDVNKWFKSQRRYLIGGRNDVIQTQAT